VTGLAEPRLDQPFAGTSDIGGRQGHGFAERVEGLLQTLAHVDRGFIGRLGGMTAQGSEPGAEHGARGNGGGPERENHERDGYEYHDGKNRQRHSYTWILIIFRITK